MVPAEHINQQINIRSYQKKKLKIFYRNELPQSKNHLTNSQNHFRLSWLPSREYVYSCHGYFCHGCDGTPDRSNLIEEGLFRQSTTGQWLGGAGEHGAVSLHGDESF